MGNGHLVVMVAGNADCGVMVAVLIEIFDGDAW
jgi:hypothetical protein